MAGSRPQSHEDAISLENSLELSTTLVRFLPTSTTWKTTAGITTKATTAKSYNNIP